MKILPFASAVLLLFGSGLSQTSNPANGAPAQTSQAPTAMPSVVPPIRVSSRITLVDVVVRGSGRETTTGLTKSNFHVTENGTPQELVSVEEHTASNTPAAGSASEMPKLPPNTYTNYRPPQSGGVNVILLDALNTPQKDQLYVRRQLLDYLKNLPDNASFAIFALGSQLRLLQPFSSDRTALLAAIESSRANASKSTLLPDDTTGPQKASDLAQEMEDEHRAPPGQESSPDLAANMRQFEAEQDTFDYEFRVRLTMSALAEIAGYVRSQPGRKDLVWISGSFPASILPNADLGNAAFDATSNLSPLIQRTTRLLTDARISVYPIDARGLMTSPVYDASTRQQSRYMSPTTHPLLTADAQFGQKLASEHAAMSSVADQTGGRAFFNTNGIKQAIGEAVAEGNHYYTLAYVPTNRNYDNTVRHVSVKVTPGNYQLSYRHTYIAGDPNAVPAKGKDHGEKGPAEIDSLHAAFESGAPTSSDILFDVSVKPQGTPAATGTVKDWKGPVVHYAIDYAIDGRDLRPEPAENGKSRMDLEVVAIAYDDLGRELNTVSQQITATLSPEQAVNLAHGALPFHQQIDLPEKTVFLRVGVAEKSSGRTGSLEITLPPAK